jgi:hypothetical protein
MKIDRYSSFAATIRLPKYGESRASSTRRCPEAWRLHVVWRSRVDGLVDVDQTKLLFLLPTPSRTANRSVYFRTFGCHDNRHKSGWRALRQDSHSLDLTVSAVTYAWADRAILAALCCARTRARMGTLHWRGFIFCLRRGTGPPARPRFISGCPTRAMASRFSDRYERTLEPYERR